MLPTIIVAVLAILLVYVIWVNYSDDFKYEFQDVKQILLGVYSADGVKHIYAIIIKPLGGAIKDVIEETLWLLACIFAIVVVPVLLILNAFVKVHVRKK